MATVTLRISLQILLDGGNAFKSVQQSTPGRREPQSVRSTENKTPFACIFIMPFSILLIHSYCNLISSEATGSTGSGKTRWLKSGRAFQSFKKKKKKVAHRHQ